MHIIYKCSHWAKNQKINIKSNQIERWWDARGASRLNKNANEPNRKITFSVCLFVSMCSVVRISISIQMCVCAWKLKNILILTFKLEIFGRNKTLIKYIYCSFVNAKFHSLALSLYAHAVCICCVECEPNAFKWTNLLPPLSRRRRMWSILICDIVF